MMGVYVYMCVLYAYVCVICKVQTIVHVHSSLTCPLSVLPHVQGIPLSSITNENSSPAAIMAIFCPLKSQWTFFGWVYGDKEGDPVSFPYHMPQLQSGQVPFPDYMHIVRTKFWYQKHNMYSTVTYLAYPPHTCTTSLPVQKLSINLTSSEICGYSSWPLPLLPQENPSPADVGKYEWKLPQLSWIMLSPGNTLLTCLRRLPCATILAQYNMHVLSLVPRPLPCFQY